MVSNIANFFFSSSVKMDSFKTAKKRSDDIRLTNTPCSAAHSLTIEVTIVLVKLRG